MRKAQAPDIHLSVQHLLNCGTAGTCNGGNAIDVYHWSERSSSSAALSPPHHGRRPPHGEMADGGVPQAAPHLT